MKQTEGEIGLMVELRAPSLFKLFHKEGNLGLGTQETCTSSRSFLRGSGTESQSSDSTYRSQAMQLDSAPKTRLPRGWGWGGWGEYHCHGNWWQTASKQATTLLWRSVTLLIHTPLLYPKALNEEGILMPLISETVIESQASWQPGRKPRIRVNPLALQTLIWKWLWAPWRWSRATFCELTRPWSTQRISV